MVLSIIATILAFGVMVILHEAGHFFVARRFGVTVHEFSVGMGPLIASKTKGDTQYSLRAVPLGGYVRLEGEDDESDDPNAFSNIHPLKRICILVAGAAVNVLLGFLCFVIITAATGYIQTNVISGVVEDTPAAEAGLQEGDKIVRLGNTSIGARSDIDLYMMGVSEGDEIKITVKRGGEKLLYKITPKSEDGRLIMGVQTEVKKPNPIETVTYSACQTRYVVRAVFYSLGQLFSGKAGIRDLSDPVGIVKVVDDTAQYAESAGATPLQTFMVLLEIFAMISVNLGVFNLLPIPALDGGSIIFAFIELVTRRKQNQNILGYINLVGLILIFGLGIVVMGSDIMKIAGA